MFLIVSRKMLGGSDHFEVMRIVSLQTAYKGDTEPTRQPRIFAIGLLRSSPAWITSHVDDGRP